MKEQLDFDSVGIAARLGANNQWVKLKGMIPWDRFRNILKVIDKTGDFGGRPPYDPVKMFKVVVLGQWHNLSDNEMENALRVRLDFLMFCGFSLNGDIPDSTTIQDWRSRMISHGVLEKCFNLLNDLLEKAELKVTSETVIIDSTIKIGRASCRERV